MTIDSGVGMAGNDHAGMSVDDLSDVERRLYDFAATAMPLAEVAVRLGVPIAEAERRITLLCSRLAVPNRAALQGATDWSSGECPADADATDIADGAAPIAPRAGRPARTSFARRVALVLPLLIALAIAAGAAYELTADNGSGAEGVVSSEF